MLGSCFSFCDIMNCWHKQKGHFLVSILYQWMQNMYILSFITFKERTRIVESGGGTNIFPQLTTVKFLLKHSCVSNKVVLIQYTAVAFQISHPPDRKCFLLAPFQPISNHVSLCQGMCFFIGFPITVSKP